MLTVLAYFCGRYVLRQFIFILLIQDKFIILLIIWHFGRHFYHKNIKKSCVITSIANLVKFVFNYSKFSKIAISLCP